MRGYPQFSFWIPTALAKICFPRIVINRAKNNSVLVGTVSKMSFVEKNKRGLDQWFSSTENITDDSGDYVATFVLQRREHTFFA